MARHHEPNASHFSARYAERKMANQRARDVAAGPTPCVKCAATQKPGSIFCATHAAEYADTCKKMSEAKMPFDAIIDFSNKFCRRTYWPK